MIFHQARGREITISNKERIEMDYPDKETYRKLYARYLSENGRNVNEMLGLAGSDFAGMRVLDLCGGAGEMARGACCRNAQYVLLVDGSKEMIGERDSDIHYSVEEVGFFLKDPWYKESGKRFDVVLCRQAVNYWMDKDMAKELSSIMNDGGVFVFNTFNSRPQMMRPLVKEYEFDGARFAEVSIFGGYCDEAVVHHVQCRQGMAPHVTMFKWISPEMFDSWLSPWFEVESFVLGKTTLYRCLKK